VKVLLATPYLTYSWATGNLILKALGELGHYAIAWDYRVSPMPSADDYDVALVQKGDGVDPRELMGYRVNWFPDRLSRYRWMHDTLARYDDVYSWNKPEYDWAEWLPLGYDEHVHRNLNLPRTLNCVYIGTANSKRKVQWVKAIKPQMVFGSEWELYGVRACQPMHLPQFVRLMNASKIVLNVHEWPIGPNGKTFEIPPCAFMLVDRVEGMDLVFPNRLLNKISFRHPKEGRELIDYYLENPKELERAWEAERNGIRPFTTKRQVEKLLSRVP